MSLFVLIKKIVIQLLHIVNQPGVMEFIPYMLPSFAGLRLAQFFIVNQFKQLFRKVADAVIFCKQRGTVGDNNIFNSSHIGGNDGFVGCLGLN